MQPIRSSPRPCLFAWGVLLCLGVISAKAADPCLQRPVFDRPVFDRPVFDRPIMEHPQLERSVRIRSEMERPTLERAQFDRPVIERPIFERCQPTPNVPLLLARAPIAGAPNLEWNGRGSPELARALISQLKAPPIPTAGATGSAVTSDCCGGTPTASATSVHRTAAAVR